MKADVCCWCTNILEVPDLRDMGITPCCKGCRDSERLFYSWMCDEAINRRAHYAELVRGEE